MEPTAFDEYSVIDFPLASEAARTGSPLWPRTGEAVVAVDSNEFVQHDDLSALRSACQQAIRSGPQRTVTLRDLVMPDEPRSCPLAKAGVCTIVHSGAVDWRVTLHV